MTRPDQLDQPLGVRRLTGLGLIPDPPGWVPAQAGQDARRGSSADLEPDPEQAPSPQRQAPPPPAAFPSVSDAIRAAMQERLPPWADGLVERVTVAAVLWTLVGLVAVVVAAVMFVHRPAGGDTAGYAAASSYSGGSGSDQRAVATPAPATSAAGGSIVVDVGGKVRRPGLVTLPSGARVADAITAAGGPLRSSELDRVDLAARVSDGQLLLVGVKADPSAGGAATDGASASDSPAPISLSDATLEQLETLPGVGPVTAQKIVDWRTAHGGFTSVSQLEQIPGIGPAHFSEISPLVSP